MENVKESHFYTLSLQVEQGSLARLYETSETLSDNLTADATTPATLSALCYAYKKINVGKVLIFICSPSETETSHRFMQVRCPSSDSLLTFPDDYFNKGFSINFTHPIKLNGEWIGDAYRFCTLTPDSITLFKDTLISLAHDVLIHTEFDTGSEYSDMESESEYQREGTAWQISEIDTRARVTFSTPCCDLTQYPEAIDAFLQELNHHVIN